MLSFNFDVFINQCATHFASNLTRNDKFALEFSYVCEYVIPADGVYACMQPRHAIRIEQNRKKH